MKKCFHTLPFAASLAGLFILSIISTDEVWAADDLSKPIRASNDGHYLVQPDGEPFFWMGDTALMLLKHLDRAETERYLTDRAAKGFNVIQVVVLGFYGDENRAGESALIENDPERPNPRYFEHVDWVVKRAAQHGIRIAMMPAWGNTGTGGYQGGKIFDASNAEIYGRWIGQRYRGKGVIYVLGGDTNILWPTSFGADQFGQDNSKEHRATIVDYGSIYDAMAKGIIEGDGGDPFMAYHPTSLSFYGTAEPRTSLYLGNRSWLDMNMLQSGHFEVSVVKSMPQVARLGVNFGWVGTRNYEPVLAEFHSLPVRPVIDAEPRWEDLPVNQTKGNRLWTADDARNAAYHAVFAGAAGHNYGNENVAIFADLTLRKQVEMEWRPWWEALSSPAAGQMQYLKNLMLSRPYFTRKPDAEVIVGDRETGERHISALRDDDGAVIMVYIPAGQKVSVDMSRISGTQAIAWWYDPRTGKAVRQEREFPTRGVMRFSPPDSGVAPNDWVLVLDDISRKFAAPGSQPWKSPKSPANHPSNSTE